MRAVVAIETIDHCQVFDLHRRIFFAFARVLDALDITSFWFFWITHMIPELPIQGVLRFL